MNKGKIYNKIKILYTRVSRDLDKDISSKKCNEYINDLESLKEELYDFDSDWLEDYKEVSEVDEPDLFSDGADEDEIHEVLDEVTNQLERILYHMGVDITKSTDVKQPTENIPSININVRPKMTQHTESSVNAQVSVEIKQEVERLAKEFEEEYQRMLPDKTFLKRIIETLKTLGPYAAPYVSKFTELLGKLW